MPSVPGFTVKAGELLQHVSREPYRGAPLYFGKSGANRYDDPAQGYGVLYLGFDLSTALMESVFHKHNWSRNKQRTITQTEMGARMVRMVGVMSNLHLANLTAPGVMAARFGLNLSQLTSRNYLHTQRVSVAVQAERDAKGALRYDGVLYPSRNNFPQKCVALFDNAAPKICLVDDINLAHHADWPDFKKTSRIVVQPK